MVNILGDFYRLLVFLTFFQGRLRGSAEQFEWYKRELFFNTSENN